MSFVHDDPDFPQLLVIVARGTGIDAALVEKDYWVTHCLWALHETGLEIWFKGSTSLSKGFGLIERFSEDLDLMLQHGEVADLPAVSNWTSPNKGPTAARVHPLVTLLEKLDALSRRYARATIEPDGFVRHFEDAAHIIRSLENLPAIEQSPRALADEMLRDKT